MKTLRLATAVSFGAFAILLSPEMAHADDARPLSLMERGSTNTQPSPAPAPAPSFPEPAAPPPAAEPAPAAAPAPAPAGAAVGAAGAGAAATAAVKKTFMLGLESEPLGLTYINLNEVGTTTDDLPNTLAFGFGAGRAGTDLSSGVLPTLGFRLGYLLSPQLVVGANVFLMGITSSTKGEFEGVETTTKPSAFGGGLTPFIHYIFSPEGTLRPFAEFRFGFGAYRTWDKERIESDGDYVETKDINEFVSPRLGLAGGVHVFVSPSVSLDIGLTFDYFAPYGRPVSSSLEGSQADDEETKFNEKYRKTADSINVGIPLGISIWI